MLFLVVSNACKCELGRWCKQIYGDACFWNECICSAGPTTGWLAKLQVGWRRWMERIVTTSRASPSVRERGKILLDSTIASGPCPRTWLSSVAHLDPECWTRTSSPRSAASGRAPPCCDSAPPIDRVEDRMRQFAPGTLDRTMLAACAAAHHGHETTDRPRPGVAKHIPSQLIHNHLKAELARRWIRNRPI